MHTTKQLTKIYGIPLMAKNTTIPTRISHMLDMRQCTQGDIAEYCGVSQATISRYLSGRLTPSYDMMIKLVEFAEKKNREIRKIEQRIKRISA